MPEFENLPGERIGTSGVRIPKLLTLDNTPHRRRIVIDGVPFPYGTQGPIKVTFTEMGEPPADNGIAGMPVGWAKFRVVHIPVLVEEVQDITPPAAQAVAPSEFQPSDG